MNYIEIASLAFSGMGIAFGFGKQSASIANLKKDTDAIARMHRDTLQELGEIKSQLARIDQRLLFLEK